MLRSTLLPLSFTHAHTHIHTRTHTYIYIYIYTHIRTHTRIHTHRHPPSLTHTYTHTHTHTHTQECLQDSFLVWHSIFALTPLRDALDSHPGFGDKKTYQQVRMFYVFIVYCYEIREDDTLMWIETEYCLCVCMTQNWLRLINHNLNSKRYLRLIFYESSAAIFNFFDVMFYCIT